MLANLDKRPTSSQVLLNISPISIRSDEILSIAVRNGLLNRGREFSTFLSLISIRCVFNRKAVSGSKFGLLPWFFGHEEVLIVGKEILAGVGPCLEIVDPGLDFGFVHRATVPDDPFDPGDERGADGIVT